MNKSLMRAVGFTKEVEDVENNICPFCAKKCKREEFRDSLSLKEFEISGLCQECQDNFFGK